MNYFSSAHKLQSEPIQNKVCFITVHIGTVFTKKKNLPINTTSSNFFYCPLKVAKIWKHFNGSCQDLKCNCVDYGIQSMMVEAWFILCHGTQTCSSQVSFLHLLLQACFPFQSVLRIVLMYSVVLTVKKDKEVKATRSHSCCFQSKFWIQWSISYHGSCVPSPIAKWEKS